MQQSGIEGERLLKLAVDASPIGMVLVDSGGEILLVNSQTEKLFGYLRKDLLGKKLSILLPGRFHATLSEQMQEIFGARESRPISAGRDLFGLRQDGGEVPLEISLNPITAGEGIFVLAFIIDNSEGRELAQSIKQVLNHDSTDEAIVGYDMNGVIQNWNGGAERIFGYSAAEMIGQPYSILVPSELSDEPVEILKRLHSGERVDFFETVRLHKDGKRIGIFTITHPVHDDAGRVVGAAKIVHDISKLEQSQRALVSIVTRQTAILKNSLDGIITIDHLGNIIDFNSAAEAMYGYQKEDILHKNLASLIIPPAFREAHAQGMKHYMATGEGPVIGQRIEITAMRADGSEFPIELAISAITSGEITMFTASTRDLTDRKKSEVALDERIRLLIMSSEISDSLSGIKSVPSLLQKCTESIVGQLEGAFVRIWRVSQSGKILELQASAGMYTHLDGPHRRVPIGRGKIGLIAQDRKPHFTNEVEDGSDVNDQDWALSEGMVAFAGYPLIVEENLMGVMAVFTQHPLSDPALETLDTVTDAIAIGISRKLTEDALVRSQRHALAANQAKSVFLANMSHEIRTPMNGVLGLTRLMLNTDLTLQQREYLEMANRSAESLLQIINDILDFSKVEADKLTLVSEAFLVGECIDNAVSDCRVSAQAKNLELRYDLDPKIPKILRGDKGRLRQVLLNLISNAIKFTNRGEIDITVRTVSVSDEEVELHFSVRDTGIGIPPERLTQVFESFEQVDTSVSRIYGGTGLGLSISAKLVSLMGGALEVESQMGVGSTFHFHSLFPVSTEPIHPKSAYAVSELRDLRVLVVDGDATNRCILQEQFIQWNMKPYCVANGKEAVQAMREACFSDAPFSLVLLDAQMPDMGGLVVAKELRDIFDASAFRGLAIIMLFSEDQQQDIARCRSIGISSCLTHPVSASQLLDTLLKILETDALGVSPIASAGQLAGRQLPQKNKEIAPPTPISSQYKAKLRILLAEDNIINQKVASGILQREGYEVTIVNNGLEAVEALENQTFCVVLMDVQMPMMDGLEATSVIRQREKASGRRVPIIALTAHAMKEDRERCLSAGMDDYTTKPIDPLELKKAIIRWTR